MEETKVNRRNEWFAMGAFSIVALVSITSEMSGDLSDQEDELKWSIVSLIIGVGVAGIGFFAHALGELFVGTIIEGLLGVGIFGVLAGGLMTIMNPSNDIAQTGQGVISNANLYFFSWGALICAMLIFMKFLRDVHGIGASKDFSVMGWTGFTAASFVVMAAATRLYKSINCDDSYDSPDPMDDKCDRTTFAFLLGAIGGIIGLVWMVAGKFAPKIVDAVLSFLMIAAWCFGVAKITFGNDLKAPAKNLGNLYFASWACFMMAITLTGDGAGKVLGLVKGEEGETTEEAQQEAPQTEEKEAPEKDADEEKGDGDSA